jgi:hypothetical protein
MFHIEALSTHARQQILSLCTSTLQCSVHIAIFPLPRYLSQAYSVVAYQLLEARAAPSKLASWIVERGSGHLHVGNLNKLKYDWLNGFNFFQIRINSIPKSTDDALKIVIMAIRLWSEKACAEDTNLIQIPSFQMQVVQNIDTVENYFMI